MEIEMDANIFKNIILSSRILKDASLFKADITSLTMINKHTLPKVSQRSCPIHVQKSLENLNYLPEKVIHLFM